MASVKMQYDYKCETTVHTWQKNDKGEHVQVNVFTTGARRYLDIRTWYPKEETGKMAMGKGCVFPLEDCHLDEFFSAIEKLKAAWESGELTKPGSK